MKTQRTWGWPIAGYLFLGGLGGGSIIVSSAADLVFSCGDAFALGSFMTAVIISLGSGLLIFELGRPLRFWRVFSTQKTIMTAGAWMLSLLIGTGFVYFTFWPDVSPWRSIVWLRQALAIVNLLLGIGVCTYTGILLGSLKPRRFWNTPALPVLFLVSGLSTGVAMQSLLAGAWPFAGAHNATAVLHSMLGAIDVALIAVELIVLLVYVLMMRTLLGTTAERAAARWLTGPFALPFWGGVVGLGLLLPLALYAMGLQLVAPICVLAGGLILRFLVVYSDDRTHLPGEARYLKRLPAGDESFLKSSSVQ